MNQGVYDAMEDGFYLGFDAVEPTGKNIVVALDVSGSMTWPEHRVNGLASMTSREAAGAMALITARTEPNVHIQAFSHQLVEVDITKRDKLTSAMQKIDRIPMGGTDCALPMKWATRGRIPVDSFYIFTDAQTWAGGQHVHEALVEYRQKMNRDAKLVCVGFGASKMTIANPDDPGMLDVVGFDTATPAIMADFTKEGYGQ